jgi:prefoldin subunit 5
MADIEKLKARREALKAQIAKIDARIARLEKAEAEAEARAVMRLIRQHGLTAEQVAALVKAREPA